MQPVAAQERAAPPSAPMHDAGGETDVMIDLRDHVVTRRRPASAPSQARARRALLVVVATAVTVAALLAAWPGGRDGQRASDDAVITSPAAAEGPPPSISVHAAPAPPVIVVERSTSSIELWLAEDAAASSATMTVGPAPGIDPVRLELLADVPVEGTRVQVQARITNDGDAALDFPGEVTVTVIGERDGQRVATAVLHLPGVTRVPGRSSQLLTGEIVLTYGTTTLRAEAPVEEPAA